MGYSKPKQVSDKRAIQLKIYSGLRKEYLACHKKCEMGLEGCTKQSTEIHHTNGREGERLNVVEWWKAICRACHDKTHNLLSAEEARELGLKK